MILHSFIAFDTSVGTLFETTSEIAMPNRTVSLDDKYTLRQGRVFITGTQALVRLPMLGAVESLNVSVASAICLYETVRQRQAGQA